MVAPSKLKSFADVNPGMAALNDPSVDPSFDGDYEDDEDDERPPAEDPKTRGLGLIGQWKDLGQALTEVAGDIVDEAHDIGGNLLLAKVPDDASEQVEDAFEKMPDDIQQCLAKYVSALPPDDVEAVATALIDGHDGETEDGDVKLVAKYLTMASAIAKEEVDPDSYADDEEEDDEDEDADEEDDGDGGGELGSGGSDDT